MNLRNHRVAIPTQFLSNDGAFARLARRLGLALVFLGCCMTMHGQERPAIHKVPPVYPPIARQMRITGVVTVVATIDAAGKVVKADSSSGNKLLAQAAIDAVRQWKFAPGDGVVTTNVQVSFETE